MASRVLADWWPLAVVAVGVRWIVAGTRLSGMSTVGLGLLLLGATVGPIGAQPGQLVGPMLLVVIGSGLVSAGAALRRAPAMPHPAVDDLTLGGTAVFGDTRLVVADGDGDVDRAVVTTTAVFGDVRVEAPAGWRVDDRTTALFGSVRVPEDQPSYPEAPVIELYGMAIFGNVRVHYLDVMEAE